MLYYTWTYGSDKKHLLFLYYAHNIGQNLRCQRCFLASYTAMQNRHCDTYSFSLPPTTSSMCSRIRGNYQHTRPSPFPARLSETHKLLTDAIHTFILQKVPSIPISHRGKALAPMTADRAPARVWFVLFRIRMIHVITLTVL